MTSRGWGRAGGTAALLVLAVLLVRAASRLDLARVAREVTTVRPGWLLGALLCHLLVMGLWAVQWHLLAPPSTHRTWRTMLGVVALSSTVLNTAPLLAGEAASVFFLVTRAGLARSAALSVLAMDQLLVGLAKIAVLAAAAATTPLPGWMARGVGALVAAVALLLLVVGVAAWRHAHVPRVLGRVLPQRAADAAGRASHALAPLRSVRLATSTFALAFAKRALELLAILAVQRAFGVPLPVTSALLVLAALHLATLVPVVPGNAGVYEAAVILAYGRYGVTPERAAGMAIVQHACAFAAQALPGYLWLAGRRAPSAAAAP